MSKNWPFTDPENLLVFTLKRITRGESPILRVTHDEDDGGWQFLDGGEVSTEDASLFSLRTMTRIDPSVLELADLPPGWVAERASPGEPWQRTPAVTEDDRERKLVSDIEEFGWHVVLIPEDGEGPAFAYSVGLYKTFGHPELIVFGIDLRVMHLTINLVGQELRRGRHFSEGESVPDILNNSGTLFLKVARRHYQEYLACARWFYKGDDFPALQCLWPDTQGRFPTDPDFPESLRPRQPLLAP